MGLGDGQAGEPREGRAPGGTDRRTTAVLFSRRRQRELIYLFGRPKVKRKSKESALGTDGPWWNFLNPLASHQRPTLEKYFASNCAAEVFLSSALLKFRRCRPVFTDSAPGRTASDLAQRKLPLKKTTTSCMFSLRILLGPGRPLKIWVTRSPSRGSGGESPRRRGNVKLPPFSSV